MKRLVSVPLVLLALARCDMVAPSEQLPPEIQATVKAAVAETETAD